MADDEEDERDTYAKKRRKGTRRPHSRLGIGLLCLVIGLVLGVIGHIAFINYNPPDTPENQPEILQASTVLERIKAENEMVGASQRYNITEKETDKNHIDTLLGTIDIPFTENSFWYRYVGTIKAGVNLSDASITQQDDGTIVVSLSQPYIISNTPDMDASGVLEEHNNILNPIHVKDVDAFQQQCMEKSESETVDNGLYDEAKANVEANIRGMFQSALGADQAIAFEWRGQ